MRVVASTERSGVDSKSLDSRSLLIDRNEQRGKFECSIGLFTAMKNLIDYNVLKNILAAPRLYFYLRQGLFLIGFVGNRKLEHFFLTFEKTMK